MASSPRLRKLFAAHKSWIARGQKDAWPRYTGAEASRGRKHQAADNDFLDQAPFSKLIRAPEASERGLYHPYPSGDVFFSAKPPDASWQVSPGGMQASAAQSDAVKENFALLSSGSPWRGYILIAPINQSRCCHRSRSSTETQAVLLGFWDKMCLESRSSVAEALSSGMINVLNQQGSDLIYFTYIYFQAI